jgi:subtilisin family serine protease
MKKIFYLLMTLSLLMSISVTVKASPSSQAWVPDTNALYVPGEVVVGFVEGGTSLEYFAQASALAHEFQAQVVKSFDRFALLQFPEETNVLEMANHLRNQPGVAFAEPNYLRWIPEAEIATTGSNDNPSVTEVELRIVTTEGVTKTTRIPLSDLRAMRTLRQGMYVPTYPNDAGLYDQWGWQAIGADIIWPDKAANPVVCVVDSGVDKGHPDLKGRVLAGYDFVDDDAVPNDENGHGTHIAGIISALINNKAGIGGISTAQIVPVRVMTAQGWGTSLDVALGIRFCADNTSVRIINLSLGGFGASTIEYTALKYAIVTRNKLVVAAAGNNSRYRNASGNLFFPAAWAVIDICKNGSDAFGSSCASGNENEIAAGLISVGAARAPWSTANDTDKDGKLWVDQNNNGTADSNELYPVSWCATDFTNYGHWVELVAPGEDILSTTPVSYPYYLNVASPYGTLSGTSQAAAHVSGAAARTWSVFPGLTPSGLETQLKNSGASLAIANDDLDDDNAGYNANWGPGEAPFCWPGAIGGDGRYDMSNARYINVAKAMGRGAFLLYVYDAASATPLYKANVTAIQSGVIRDKATVASNSASVTLINLPASSVPYVINVQKSGYTGGTPIATSLTSSGPATFLVPAGAYGFNSRFIVGVPRMGLISAVVNWVDGVKDLDAYIALPNTSSYDSAGLGIGKLDPGSLSSIVPNPPYVKPPYARWFRDGGLTGNGDAIPFELIAIKPKPGTVDVPYYNNNASDKYYFMIKTNSNGSEWVIFRLWVNGRVIVTRSYTCGSPWQRVGYMQGNTFHDDASCGTSSVWPYNPPNFAP